MSEMRAAVTYHFKLDPAKQTIGLVGMPAEITRTISFGDEIKTEKVALETLPMAEREQLEVLISRQVVEAIRVAKPIATTAPAPAVATSTPDPLPCAVDEEEGLDLFA